MSVCMTVCMSVCMYVCMYVCRTSHVKHSVWCLQVMQTSRWLESQTEVLASQAPSAHCCSLAQTQTPSEKWLRNK